MIIAENRTAVSGSRQTRRLVNYARVRFLRPTWPGHAGKRSFRGDVLDAVPGHSLNSLTPPKKCPRHAAGGWKSAMRERLLG